MVNLISVGDGVSVASSTMRGKLTKFARQSISRSLHCRQLLQLKQYKGIYARAEILPFPL